MITMNRLRIEYSMIFSIMTRSRSYFPALSPSAGCASFASFARTWSGFFVASATHPLQQRKAGRPLSMILTGTPIDPSDSPETGQTRWASACSRSPAASLAIFCRSSAERGVNSVSGTPFSDCEGVCPVEPSGVGLGVVGLGLPLWGPPPAPSKSPRRPGSSAFRRPPGTHRGRRFARRHSIP